jgi:hypothetical protein
MIDCGGAQQAVVANRFPACQMATFLRFGIGASPNVGGVGDDCKVLAEPQVVRVEEQWTHELRLCPPKESFQITSLNRGQKWNSI